MLKEIVYEEEEEKKDIKEEIKEIKKNINKLEKFMIVSIIVLFGMIFFLFFELIDPYWI